MAQTYIQLRQQIEALQRQADKVREEEMTGVVSRIKEAISHYGLTAAHLGLESPGRGNSKQGQTAGRGKAVALSASKASSGLKYANGQGGVWGGRGPRPLWLRMALNEGSTLDQFAVSHDVLEGGPSNSTAAASLKSEKPRQKTSARAIGKRTKSSASAKPRVTYRDDAGNTWGGMGPRPKWLKEAIDGGKPLSELVAG